MVLVLKRLRRRGKWLEVSSDRLGELGICFVDVFLGCTSTGRVGFCFLWFFVQELPKAQAAVVLVLKCLRRRGNGLKSQLGIVVCGRVPWLYQYWPGGFMLFVVLCPGTPEGSTGSGSDLKASQKMGQQLKGYEKPGIEPATPGLQDIGLSPTPRRLRQYI